MYGSTLVREFDSLALETVQLAIATGSYLTDEKRAKKVKGGQPLGLARTTTNQCINRIRRIWRWGCSKKIVPADCLVNIESLAGLKQGRSVARETEIVMPVDSLTVENTLPYMPPVPADRISIEPRRVCTPLNRRLLGGLPPGASRAWLKTAWHR